MRWRSVAALPLLQVEAVEEDPPGVGGVEAGQQLDQGGLPRAVLADQGQALPGAQVQGDLAQGRRLAAGIGEADALEAHPVPRVGAGGQAAGRLRHLLLQVLVEIGEVEVVLVHAADRREAGRDRRLPLLEEHQVHRHLAEADRPLDRGDGDPGVGAVEGGGADQAEDEPPGVAAQGQAFVLGEDPGEDVAVALQQLGAEAVELDLLGVVLPGEDGLDVHLHARVGGAPAEEAEFVAGIFGLDEELGKAGESEHNYGPGGELDQQGGVAEQRDGVLHQAEGAGDQAQGADRGLAAGAGELVVELRILEVREAQGERLLQDHHVDPLPHQRPQERLAGGDAALGGGEGGYNPRLHGNEEQDPPGLGGAGLPVHLHGGDHRVDDQLPHPGRRRRQHPGRQSQQRQPESQAAAGRPDQLQRPAAVAEDADEAPRQVGIVISQSYRFILNTAVDHATPQRTQRNQNLHPGGSHPAGKKIYF